jgi:HlyD family secretion protein
MANPKSKKRRKLIIFLVLGLGVAGLVLAVVLQKREPIVTIQTEKVARRNLTETVVANGRIQPVVQVKISAEVSGEIIELPVKEGQRVNKGDLLVKIKPDVYIAQRNSAEAGFLSAQSGLSLSAANLSKAEQEYQRNDGLFRAGLISESVFLEYKTAFDIARAQYESSTHQVEVARASLARVEEELRKTTIYSPLEGTISKLNSELGERVVGTAMMSGTEIMTVADLKEMEARVDIGEIDIVLIALGQTAQLEVDAFRDRKFKGMVTEIANSSKGTAFGGGGQSQEATKFEVRIRVNDQESFRPGMSVTAEVQTRSRTNVLAVPIQSVTTRLPRASAGTDKTKGTPGTNSPTGSATNELANTNTTASSTNAETAGSTKGDKKAGDAPKPIEVVFLLDGERVKQTPVKRGISDDDYVEILEGLQEGQEVVSGGYRAISKDLEDGKRVRKGAPEPKKDQGQAKEHS